MRFALCFGQFDILPNPRMRIRKCIEMWRRIRGTQLLLWERYVSPCRRIRTAKLLICPRLWDGGYQGAGLGELEAMPLGGIAWEGPYYFFFGFFLPMMAGLVAFPPPPTAMHGVLTCWHPWPSTILGPCSRAFVDAAPSRIPYPKRASVA